MKWVNGISSLLACCTVISAPARAQNAQPGTAYIFPAGGQQGTEIRVTIGGYNLTPSTELHFDRSDIQMVGALQATDKSPPPVPAMKGELSNRAYSYPRELEGSLTVGVRAELGLQTWRVCTAQGGTSSRLFVVGDLPEVIEPPRGPGEALPQRISPPMTANGRIELAEEIDDYVFHAEREEQFDCEVLAGRIGSTLDARLEVLDPTGRVVASDEDSQGVDPRVHFTAGQAGDYVVRVHDFDFSGSPSHVYRLTVRKLQQADREAPASVALTVNGGAKSARKIEESEPNDTRPESIQALPVEIAGHLQPGDIDCFRFEGRKGDRLALSVWAARLGWNVDSVLLVSDLAGKEIARSDDIPGSSDSELEFSVPADGEYVASVSDLSGSPAGELQSRYHLLIGPAQPDFALSFAADFVDVAPGGSTPLTLKVNRSGGFDGEIDLTLEGLPRGVTAENLRIPAKRADHKLTLTAASDVEVKGFLLRVKGTAKVVDQTLDRVASIPNPGGNPLAKTESALVTVTCPCPFKITADDTYCFASRGATHPATLKILREPPFDGEVVLSLADKQIRYLQGVSGPTMVVPPGTSEVIYPLFLPETMSLNRTCRVLIAGTATVTGAEGRVHHVMAVSPKQCVMRLEPAVLALTVTPDKVELKPGNAIQLTLNVQRALSFRSPVHIDLVLPDGARGLTANSADVSADQTAAVVTLHLAPDASLAGHEAIRFRAIGYRDDLPVAAEASLEMELLATH